jgi:hypothetical protein
LPEPVFSPDGAFEPSPGCATQPQFPMLRHNRFSKARGGTQSPSALRAPAGGKRSLESTPLTPCASVASARPWPARRYPMISAPSPWLCELIGGRIFPALSPPGHEDFHEWRKRCSIIATQLSRPAGRPAFMRVEAARPLQPGDDQTSRCCSSVPRPP